MVKFSPQTCKGQKMFKRNLQKKLEKALTRSPVVLLTGPRQSGKTTLMKEISKIRGYSYVTFDDINFLSAAKNDPMGFIAGLNKPVLLDEVQRVPELFLAIKHDVDENRTPGRYALTGSANPLLIPRLGDSLAGRMEIFDLFPLSQGELSNSHENFIDIVFSKQIPLPAQTLSRADLYKKIAIGGYPPVQGFDFADRESWFNSYVTTLLQRDIQDLSQITGFAEFPRLLNLLATRTSSLLNVSELARTSGIAGSTLNRYLILLETIFLIKFHSAWSSNLGKRLVRSSKITFIDTGLLLFSLGVDLEKLPLDNIISGPVLENFVISELDKQLTWNQVRAKLYHARTTTGIEVDIILEDAAGNLVGIEVKNSSTIGANDFKGLKFLQESAGRKFVQGIVLYTGSQHVPFAAKLSALPINVLWNIKKISK